MVTSFFVLLTLVIVGAAVANRLPVPHAIVWCILGFTIAFVPKLPLIQFDPQIALFFFLPPLIYASAVDLPWPEFRDNIRSIAVLGIGLVLATAALVGVVAHHWMHLPWGVAIVLSAILSPTDPVAATAVAERVGIPRRLIAILEGEGLVNDAVALTIFRLALAAAITGSFSIRSGLTRFAAILFGEPLYGWLLGIAAARVRSKITDARLEIAVSLLTPFAAYLVPERLGGSGILATVATGMYIGERRSTLVPAGTRLHATSFWQMIVFLLNGVLFLAAGAELQRVVVTASSRPELLVWGLAAAAAVISTRFLWCAGSCILLWMLRQVGGRERHPLSPRHLVIVAWSGIRGPISLAAALAIPAFSGQAAFPAYGIILSVTAVVVICTLFLQGLTLSPLVRLLRIGEDAKAEREQAERQELMAEAEAKRAALRLLSQLERENKVPKELALRIRRHYEDQLADLETGMTQRLTPVLAALLDAERARILELRNEGRINDQTLTRLERRMDLRQSLLN